MPGASTFRYLALFSFAVGCATSEHGGSNIDRNDDVAEPVLGSSGGHGGSGPVLGTGAAGGQQGNDQLPATCESAAEEGTYVGCDYWPTPVSNSVRRNFNFSVAVANASPEPANVTVTGPNAFSETRQVQPGSLTKMALPWVAGLKGEDFDNCQVTPLSESGRVNSGAYHLVSTRPVAVYQFNPLEFEVSGACPTSCKQDCNSLTNDASLLLPSTALTASYRVSTWAGDTRPTYLAITAMTDGTNVNVKLGPGSGVLAGPSVVATPAGGELSFGANAGDVVQLVAGPDRPFDLSGTIVNASNPVQIISGSQCSDVPDSGTKACDHLEEIVFPGETLGKRYVVAAPTGPNSEVTGHVVHIHGNVNETSLTYSETAPEGALSSINAGETVSLGLVSRSFLVEADQPFSISTFLPGGQLLDPDAEPEERLGDPSQSMSVSIEQYLTNYTFLAPPNYTASFIDVVAPTSLTSLKLDGEAVSLNPEAVAGTEFQVHRVQLSNAGTGAHQLEADAPVGIQVIGYGRFTSYQYPGGLNLRKIAEPPTIH